MIVVASVLPAWKMDDPGLWGSWLKNAEEIRASHPDGVSFLAVIELDARGREPFAPLLERLAEVDGEVWTFSLDDGAEAITSRNRLVRICTGRNLASHYAQEAGADWILFADADTCIPGDALPKLLEVGWPIVGGCVPTYALSGPTVGDYPFPVTEHVNTAGFLLVQRRLFTRLRWRIDIDQGMTDDPCYHADAAALGWATRVREDCIARHYPESIGPIEQRGMDLVIRR